MSVDRPFETEPANADGIAVLKPVKFKVANKTISQITLRTQDVISDDERLAKLELRVSTKSFHDLLNEYGNLNWIDAPFVGDQLGDAACAEGTFHDHYACVPPLLPTNCENPQAPFDLTDCAGNPSFLRGSFFVVTGTLENYPQNTVVKGLMVLLFP